MWAVHVSLLMKMFSLTASLSQEVASTLDLGLSSDASVFNNMNGALPTLCVFACLFSDQDSLDRKTS
jgi:hypothetical protein